MVFFSGFADKKDVSKNGYVKISTAEVEILFILKYQKIVHLIFELCIIESSQGGGNS